MKEKKQKNSKVKSVHINPLNLVYTKDPQKGKTLEINMSPLQAIVITVLFISTIVLSIKKLVKAIKRLFKR